MKKNLFYLFALICSMSLFTACSDDDDEKDDSQVDKSVLIGKWVLTNYTDEYTEDGKTETDTESCEVADEVDVILFNEDGSCQNYAKVGDDYDWNDKGSWSLVDKTTLKLLFFGEGQQTAKILKLTETTLSFESTVDYGDGSVSKYTATYQKVK